MNIEEEVQTKDRESIFSKTKEENIQNLGK
jgi:hypothetical protein